MRCGTLSPPGKERFGAALPHHVHFKNDSLVWLVWPLFFCSPSNLVLYCGLLFRAEGFFLLSGSYCFDS